MVKQVCSTYFDVKSYYKKIYSFLNLYKQCLGSGSESVGFWLPGYGSVKIYGSKGQNINQNPKKNFFNAQNQNLKY